MNCARLELVEIDTKMGRGTKEGFQRVGVAHPQSFGSWGHLSQNAFLKYPLWGAHLFVVVFSREKKYERREKHMTLSVMFVNSFANDLAV